MAFRKLHTNPTQTSSPNKTKDYLIFVRDVTTGVWEDMKISIKTIIDMAADGAIAFLGLSDTPSSYTGAADKILKVNSGQTAVEFSDKLASQIPQLDEVNTFIEQQTFSTAPKLSSILGANVLGTDSLGNVINNGLIEYFDATVGIGGNYPATSISNGLEQAIADGKKKIKIISDIVIYSNIVLNQNIEIGFDKPTRVLDLVTYNITGSYFIVARDGIIKSTRALGTGNPVFANYGVSFERITLDNSTVTVANSQWIYISNGNEYFTFIDCILLQPNKNGCGFRSGGTGGSLIVNGIKIRGGGGACYEVMRMASNGTVNSININRVRIDVSGALSTVAGQYAIFLGDGVRANDINLGTNSSIRLFKGFYTNITTGTLTFGIGSPTAGVIMDDFLTNFTCNTFELLRAYSNTRISNGKVVNATIICNNDLPLGFTTYCNIDNVLFYNNVTLYRTSPQELKLYINLTKCNIEGNLIIYAPNAIVAQNTIAGTTLINTDYVIFQNNICTGTLTIAAGSDYNIILGNRLIGGLTNNNVPDTTNEINNNTN